jgi:hypothetical protein
MPGGLIFPIPCHFLAAITVSPRCIAAGPASGKGNFRALIRASFDQDAAHCLEQPVPRRMAGMRQAERSIHGRSADCLFVLEALQHARPPQRFELHMTELAAEGKMAKVRQYCRAREGNRRKIRCCGDIESVADDMPNVGNERLNAGPCLSGRRQLSPAARAPKNL